MLSLLAAVLFSQCATGIADSAQTFCGSKTFSTDMTVQGGAYADFLFTPGDLYLGGLVRIATNGQSFTFLGRRGVSDPDAEMTIRETNDRPSGGMVLDLRRYGNESMYAIDNVGNVYLRGVLDAENPNHPFGTIIDNTGVAGHYAMMAGPGLGLTIAGRFGDPSGPCALRPDGGASPDGGCWPFAGRHGDNTGASMHPRHEGMLQDWQNPQSGYGAYTDKKAFIDFEGGFGQAHGLNRAQFGACPSELVMVVYPGSQQQFQFRYGHEVSVQLFAFDEQRWYVCTEAGWIGLATSDDIAHLYARLADAGL